MKTIIKITRRERSTFERYLNGRVTISEACARLGFLRKYDGRADFNTFYRRFHHYIIGDKPAL